MLCGRFGLVLCLAWLPLPILAGEPVVAIRADFPGGNVLVVKNAGRTIELAPDLRGGRPWFYWHFEAEASQPGRVEFVFADPPRVGVRGPAISHDQGHTWEWLGAEHVEYAPPLSSKDPAPRRDTFHYDFTDEHRKVRFAVAIPYLERDLHAFLKRHADNPHLEQHRLTRSREGKPVELLLVGEPAAEKQAVLLTARHHACESMASYVLEGFLQEAMSESPSAVEFRRRHFLLAVPLVDKDGVQAGDQGKWRDPHDHNRDYGEAPFYPEIAAIQELAQRHQVRFALDLHCPALRGDVHEVFYFVGITVPHIYDNVNELIAWIKEERPPVAGRPLNFFHPLPAVPPKRNMKFSEYFAYQDQIVLAATMEIPYTQPNCPLDAAMAREYGVGLLRAWVRTPWRTATDEDSRGAAAHAELAALRTSFQKAHLGNAAAAEQLAEAAKQATATPVWPIEANNLLAKLRIRQRRYAEALPLCEAVLNHPGATTQQKADAHLLRIQAVCNDPSASALDLTAPVDDFEQFPYPSLEQQFKVYGWMGDFFLNKKDYVRALNAAQRQLSVSSPLEKGRTFNRLATLYELRGEPEQAIAMRQQAIAVLRPQLDPAPVSIFGALMCGDLLDALLGLPTSTPEEIRQAAQRVLDHKISPMALRSKAEAAIAAPENR